MRSRLFYTLTISLLLLPLFAAQYTGIVFSASSLPLLSASPDASITIAGPTDAFKDEEVTYIINYNGITPTGGVGYVKDAGFEIVSVNPPYDSERSGYLIWPYHTIAPGGTITIVGKQTACDNSTILVPHRTTIFDTHPEPVELPGHSDSIETGVDCNNEPPTVSDVGITPSIKQPDGEFLVLSTNENLTVEYDYADSDNDPEGETQIRWTRDERPQSAFDDQDTIPSEETYIEEKWCVIVTPHDGKVSGEPSEQRCAYIESIRNELPEALEVTINPENASNNDELTVNYDYRDGNQDKEDKNQIEYRWSRDGSFQPTLNDLATIDLAKNAADFGEEWCVVVRPHDGKEHGLESEQACTIINPPGNRLPSVDSAEITPMEPIDSEPLNLTYNYRDPEGDDEKGSEIQWYRNGLLQPAFNGQGAVSAQFTNAGEEWYAAIKPKDGLDGEYFGARVETAPVLISSLSNTPPEATEAQIIPAGAGDEDRLRLTYKFIDVEGDIESESSIKWYRNGAYMPDYDGRTVILPDVTSIGEEWSAKLTPNDGKDAGDEVEVAAVTILSVRENVPPQALDPYLSRGIPGVEERLKLHYEYYDADGDSQGQTQIRWTVDGSAKEEYNQLTLILPRETQVGQEWCATVTPHDGEVSGEEVPVARCVTIELVGSNTAPEAKNQSMKRSRPSSRDNLELEYEYFDLDNDGQGGTSINWTVDGQLVDTFSGLTVIPGNQSNEGESWMATIRPNDGYDVGTAVFVTTTINSRPKLSNVRLEGDPGLNQPLKPYYEYDDANGDPEAKDLLELQWFKNGEHQNEHYNELTVPASETAGGERWYVIVKAHDGYEYSENVTSEQIIISYENRYYIPLLQSPQDGR